MGVGLGVLGLRSTGFTAAFFGLSPSQKQHTPLLTILQYGVYTENVIVIPVRPTYSGQLLYKHSRSPPEDTYNKHTIVMGIKELR